MELRRERILDAAEELIRTTGGTDFSVRTLAAAAQVAPATPFNLFASKDGLLYALLWRNLGVIIEEGLRFHSTDPLIHVVEAVTNAVDMFLRDPGFMRPLYKVLLGVSHAELRPRFMARSLGYWRAAIATIPERDLRLSPAQRDALVFAMQAQFIGLLEAWVQHELDDAAFRPQSVFGVLALVVALLESPARDRMLTILRDVPAHNALPIAPR